MDLKVTLVSEFEREYIRVKQDEINYVDIELKRTVRVANNKDMADLPRGQNFTLFPVAHFKESLPEEIHAKGGIVVPVYQREALFVSFASEGRFAITVYTGEVNAISGMSSQNDANDMAQLKRRSTRGTFTQGYVVRPEQNELFGWTKADGALRQFVAPTLESSTKVELAEPEVSSGIWFEVTPWKDPVKAPTGEMFKIVAQTRTGRSYDLELDKNDMVDTLKDRLQDVSGIPPDTQRLYFGGKPLEPGRPLESYGLEDGCQIIFDLRLGAMRGGETRPSMQKDVSGTVHHCVQLDRSEEGGWDVGRTAAFSVQILDTQLFSEMSGMEAPPTDVDAQFYANLGREYPKNRDEPAARGDHKPFKSIHELDLQPDILQDRGVTRTDVFIPTQPPKQPFHHREKLEEELGKIPAPPEEPEPKVQDEGKRSGRFGKLKGLLKGKSK